MSLESKGFKIAVFVGSAAAAAVTFANILSYSKLRKDEGMTAIKKSTATTMMWLNIVLFVISLALLIWSVWVLLFSRTKPAASQKQIIVTGTAPPNVTRSSITVQGGQ